MTKEEKAAWRARIAAQKHPALSESEQDKISRDILDQLIVESKEQIITRCKSRSLGQRQGYAIWKRMTERQQAEVAARKEQQRAREQTIAELDQTMTELSSQRDALDARLAELRQIRAGLAKQLPANQSRNP